MNRRTLLLAAGPAFGVPTAGCLTGEPTEGDEHACTRDEWPVIIYNESPDVRSVTVQITDADGTVVFSDTVEVDPNTDRFSGVELDTTVQVDRAYTFEADLSGGGEASTETVDKCGDVYIFVTEDGGVDIRDDSNLGD